MQVVRRAERHIDFLILPEAEVGVVVDSDVDALSRHTLELVAPTARVLRLKDTTTVV